MNEKFYIVTLGCDKNRVDAEMMTEKLISAGYEYVSKAKYADFAIVNTCAFKEDATQESINEVLEIGMYKDVGSPKYIIVTGCMAQRFKEQILEDMSKEVDAIVGIGANGDIVNIVKRVLNGEKVITFPPKENLPLEGKKVQSTMPHYGYIKIAEGCNNRCSYCTIASIRGRYRSRKIENIVAQASDMANNGVRELILVAQDTTSYGTDLYGKAMLPQLLRELAKIEKLSWIRLLYCYPNRISDELLDVIAEEEKIVKYLDIPMQHANGKVLKEMNRSGDKESLEKLITYIRKKVPGIAIRTTFIVGFPGETRDEFIDLLQFAYDMKFERMGCFKYACEDGTPAGERTDQTREEDKIIRYRTMIHQQAMLIDEYNGKLVGSIVTVMHDGIYEKLGCGIGRSYTSAPEIDPVIFYQASDDIVPGTLLRVKITDVRYSDLIGEIVGYEDNDNKDTGI